MKKKSLFVVAYTFKTGGAARATVDFIKAAENSGYYVTPISTSFNSAYKQGIVNCFRWLPWSVLTIISRLATKGLGKKRLVKQSLNLFSNPTIIKELNDHCSDAVFHFHWIANDTVSIYRFKDLPNNSIITLHDEWFFLGLSHCNTEHIIKPGSGVCNVLVQYIDTYVKKVKKEGLMNRPDITYTVPSTWMKSQFENADIGIDVKNIKVIPNAIDTNVFKSISILQKKLSRHNKSISNEAFVICFGADNSGNSLIKGTDLFKDLLVLLNLNIEISHKIEIIIFGGLNINNDMYENIKIHNFGKIFSRKQLAEMYSMSDIFLCLSRREAFGLCVGEAMACGLPVLGFDDTGITDMVINNKTGFLIRDQNPIKIEEKIVSILNLSKTSFKEISKEASKHINTYFNQKALDLKYKDLLEEVIN